METFVTIIHALTALLIILAVLLQGGNQGGMGAAFGGGNSSSTFGAAGSTSFLGKITYVTAAVFMITSIWLTILQGSGYDIGLSEKLQQDPQNSTPLGEPATTTLPQESAPTPSEAGDTPTDQGTAAPTNQGNQPAAPTPKQENSAEGSP